MNLFDIQQPEDIKRLSSAQLSELARQIRTFLIEIVAKTGGHLSSNLGIVELTLAMHYVFETPQDKFIYDVGHQSYIHKILTGRAKDFAQLRQYKGIAGFQKRRESEHDVWEAGHSSTSLSAGLGLAVARDLNNEHFQVVPVIGDGALTGGMAIEALNQIGAEQRNMVIVFNDNNMSISSNVGAMADAFTKLRTSKPYNTIKEDLKASLSTSQIGKDLLKTMQNVKNSVKKNVVESNIFKVFNIDYIGPVDGHNLPMLIKVLSIAKRHEGPIVVHVLTQKGKGYSFAEEDRDGRWHGVSQFDVKTGESFSKIPAGQKSWSEIISDTLIDLSNDNQDIVAITPAMKGGSKLGKFFDTFPQRSFDCGIAEEHAMTFAAALAQGGKRPFISVYSSFLQRAYDQINHDVARMDLPVVIGIDRCGLVGEDGETHHGVFDIAMLRSIPNLVLSQPKDSAEAQNLLYTAFLQPHPFTIRYPRGNASYQKVSAYEAIEIGSWTRWHGEGDIKLTIITHGSNVDKVISKAHVNHLPIQVINARFFKPIDTKCIDDLCEAFQPIFIYETDMLAGGLSSAILEYANDAGYPNHFIRIGLDDHFVEHGSLPQLRKVEQIDINNLFQIIISYL